MARAIRSDDYAVSRRTFARALSGSLVGAASSPVVGALNQLAAAPSTSPIVDTHMHVWANEPKRFPFAHPYVNDFVDAPHAGSVEMLIEDMDQHGCTHAVVVQVIFHGWDNRYIADCCRRYPERLRVHGLIDPTDPQVAAKLEYWVKEHGLHGMRFSPIYYRDGQHGGDAWLDASETHSLWRKAEQLEAKLNFFIAPQQIPKLEKMVRAHPNVQVIIDHLSQLDFKAADPEPDLRRLLAMARYPNVVVKLSELSSVSKSGKYPFADAFPYLKRVYDSFGPDRLLFGTGYPGAARAFYKRPMLNQEINLIRRELPFLSNEDRDKILGGNAVRIWNFPT